LKKCYCIAVFDTNWHKRSTI